MSKKFNGGYIEASQEAYDLLVAIGYKPQSEATKKYFNEEYFEIVENEITVTTYKEDCTGKQFYINNGKLSWEKLVEIQQICDNPDVNNTNSSFEPSFKVYDEVLWGNLKGVISEISTIARDHTTYLVKFERHRDMYLGDGVLKLWDDGAIEKESNDGGKNDFYTFAPYVKNVDSLSRFLGLSFSEGNILKSLTSNLGDRHDGTDAKREAKKCLHYAVERMLYTFTPEEILSQIQKQLKGK